MKFEELIEKLNGRQNGAFIKVVYTGDLPVPAKLKKAGTTGIKVSEMVIRKGIAYANQKSVIEKVEAGKILTHELPWGNWKPGFEGLIIEHKGNDYVRLYPTPNSTHTTYFINGIEKAYNELRGLVNESFFNKSGEKPDCFTIKIENITEIIDAR